VVLSRKAVLEQQLAELRRDLLENLKEGVVLQGTVKNITDYGVFVDLGAIDGLLHISDISWGRTGHPSKLFEKGEQISVKVLQFDRQNERVSLGFKQLQPDPWTEVSRKYHVGSKVAGTVVSVTDYGVFLEIEQGVEGLIHISEMSWSKHPRSPKRAFSVGDQLEAVVLNLDVERKRLSLGLRQLKPDPWAVLADTCSVGSIVRGTVRNLTDFGAFVEVAEGVDGLIHISDLAWSHQVRHPSDLLKKGQEVRSVVLHMDTVNHRLSLGIKQLHTEAWERFFSVHHVHDTVTGKVSRLTPFGAFVELAGGIEALCHQSQMREPPAGSQPLSIGDVRTFKIIKLQPTEKKIGLSLEAERLTPPDQQVTPEIQKATAQAAAKTRSADSALRSDSFDRT
jgi:small subunit ribosomal protein S1